MTGKTGYVWHLRRLMAERGMFVTTDLGPLLAMRGVCLSRGQVYRLVTRTPNGSAWPPWPRCATSWAASRVIWSSPWHPAAGSGCLVVSWVRGLRARSGRGVPVSCPVLARTRDGERARVLPGPARGRSAPVLRQLFTLPPGRPGGPGHRG